MDIGEIEKVWEIEPAKEPNRAPRDVPAPEPAERPTEKEPVPARDG